MQVGDAPARPDELLGGLAQPPPHADAHGAAYGSDADVGRVGHAHDHTGDYSDRDAGADGNGRVDGHACHDRGAVDRDADNHIYGHAGVLCGRRRINVAVGRAARQPILRYQAPPDLSGFPKPDRSTVAQRTTALSTQPLSKHSSRTTLTDQDLTGLPLNLSGLRVET